MIRSPKHVVRMQNYAEEICWEVLTSSPSGMGGYY
jgi:hypothetical protein